MNLKKLFLFLFSSIFLLSACTTPTPKVHVGDWISDRINVQLIVETQPYNEELIRLIKEYYEPFEREQYQIELYEDGTCNFVERSNDRSSDGLPYQIEDGELLIGGVSIGKVAFANDQMTLSLDAIEFIEEDTQEMMQEFHEQYDGKFDSIQVTQIVEVHTFDKKENLVNKSGVPTKWNIKR